MTVTLRPDGAARTAADGGRAQTFAICVNGRPVGRVGLRADPAPGGPVGKLEPITVDPADRGRGRGTAAALMAEEVLRGWGCTSVQSHTLGAEHQERARRWAEALGHGPRSRNMVKELPDTAPALPPDAELRPMDPDFFEHWEAAGSETYVASLVASGLDEPQARRRAEESHRQALPDGLDSPDTSLTRLFVAGEPVGSLWVRTANGPDDLPWIYDVLVDEAHRGRGHGRTLLLAAEGVVRAAGQRRLGLHVFADNVPANRLYDSLGYVTYSYNFVKPL